MFLCLIKIFPPIKVTLPNKLMAKSSFVWNVFITGDKELPHEQFQNVFLVSLLVYIIFKV